MSELLSWTSFLEWETNQDKGRLDAADMAAALNSITTNKKGGPS